VGNATVQDADMRGIGTVGDAWSSPQDDERIGARVGPRSRRLLRGQTPQRFYI
jgi:hypothetical protein